MTNLHKKSSTKSSKNFLTLNGPGQSYLDTSGIEGLETETGETENLRSIVSDFLVPFS